MVHKKPFQLLLEVQQPGVLAHLVRGVRVPQHLDGAGLDELLEVARVPAVLEEGADGDEGAELGLDVGEDAGLEEEHGEGGHGLHATLLVAAVDGGDGVVEHERGERGLHVLVLGREDRDGAGDDGVAAGEENVLACGYETAIF